SFPLTQNRWNRISLPLDFDSSFTRFYFRRDVAGEATAYFDNIRFVAPTPPTWPGADRQIPLDYALEQNYPNPFNPSTTITFSLPRAGNADLRVFDLLGREVATIAKGEFQAGTYNFVFDPSGDRHLSSGVYFYRLQVGDFVETRKMMLMR
ncbi:MAG: T9SS type A sorting domain-containing protein, partial [Ignavibacteria bacterium]|nr:T9SS type A sorting domain-containing protein [Ignavibacteria bacterium]